MFANAKGCDHVDGLFPQAHIEWRELPRRAYRPIGAV